VTDELVDAFARLVPQLSRTAGPPGREALEGIVGSPAVTVLVARAEGTIVGTLTLAMFPIPTGFRAWIEDVVVDEAARGRGRLYERAGFELRDTRVYRYRMPA